MSQNPARALRIVILASGNGTNAERIAEYFRDSELGQVSLILTNSPRAGVLKRAERLGIPSRIMSSKVYNDGAAMLALLQEAEADLIVAAGYLKLIPEEVVLYYRGAIVNVHPSLLPAYGGKGMYGMRVHEAVIAAGETRSGITIHLVDERYDEGEILEQAKVDIQPDWTPEDLAAAIHGLEYAHFPLVIERVLERIRSVKRKF